MELLINDDNFFECQKWVKMTFFQNFFWQIILTSVSKLQFINKFFFLIFTLRTSKKRRQNSQQLSLIVFLIILEADNYIKRYTNMI